MKGSAFIAALTAIAALATGCSAHVSTGVSGSSGTSPVMQGIENNMRSSGLLLSFLRHGYLGSTIVIDTVLCVQRGASHSYSCIIEYSVAGSPSGADGKYQLAAGASCDASGNCRWKTDPLGAASRES